MLILSKESDGNVNISCISNNVESYLENKRRKLFEKRDTQWMSSYFINQECKKKKNTWICVFHARSREVIFR